MTRSKSCEYCSANGINEPGEIWAPWYDENGKTDGEMHFICLACLRASPYDGPGYRWAAHPFDLEHAIDEAQGRCRLAGGPHELRRGERAVLSDDGWTPVYCNGEVEGCSVCAEAKDDEACIERMSYDALNAVRSGDFAGAAEILLDARDIEYPYFGDAPTWGPVARLAERLLAERGGDGDE